MRVRWTTFSMFGATPGLWRTLLDDQGERDLRAVLKLLAESPLPQGETWQGDERVPNMIRVQAADGTDLWLCPWRIVAVSFEAPFEFTPGAAEAPTPTPQPAEVAP